MKSLLWIAIWGASSKSQKYTTLKRLKVEGHVLVRFERSRRGTPKSTELPEQILIFDIQFNRSLKIYTIASVQNSIPPWHDLDSEPDFTLQNETSTRGDFVTVKLYDKSDSDGDIAHIDDVKALPSPDQRKLVLLSWVYPYNGTYHGSNYMQIVLWDTIGSHAATEQVQGICHDQFYNACGGVKLCGKKQADVWQKRKDEKTQLRRGRALPLPQVLGQSGGLLKGYPEAALHLHRHKRQLGHQGIPVEAWTSN
ncbi:hypothetical protein LTR84_011929 [Exophiala bonariae]|uniref:C2 domain-containing protein n=1 Tax=Exophiala bonariae TaxID=1690606 RepID=A0AAV9MUJ0_9EURO|nr:hypothetical protein LTR84_011929 [Exophiala bonariae]